MQRLHYVTYILFLALVNYFLTIVQVVLTSRQQEPSHGSLSMSMSPKEVQFLQGFCSEKTGAVIMTIDAFGDHGETTPTPRSCCNEKPPNRHVSGSGCNGDITSSNSKCSCSKENDQKRQEDLENANFFATMFGSSKSRCEQGRSVNLQPSGPWLSVTNRVIFRRDNCSGDAIFTGKINMKNMLSTPVTFLVVPTNAKLFRLLPYIETVPPKGKKEVIVVAREKADAVDFRKIADEAFMVFSIPLSFKQHSDAKSPSIIETLWKNFGGRLFPFSAAEQHVIDLILPADEDYIGDEILGRIKKIPFNKPRDPVIQKIKEIVQRIADQGSMLTYLNACAPKLENQVVRKDLIQEYRGILYALTELKKSMKCVQNIYTCISIFVVVALLLGVCYAIFYGHSDNSYPFTGELTFQSPESGKSKWSLFWEIFRKCDNC